jgi:hypothetical protein
MTGLGGGVGVTGWWSHNQLDFNFLPAKSEVVKKWAVRPNSRGAVGGSSRPESLGMSFVHTFVCRSGLLHSILGRYVTITLLLFV